MVFETDIMRAIQLKDRRRSCLVVLAGEDRKALEEVIEESGASDLAVFHIVLKGTPEFDQLSAQAQQFGTTDTPRAHLFAPADERNLAPNLLVGEQFSAEALARAVDLVADWTHQQCKKAWEEAMERMRTLTGPSNAAGGGGGGGGASPNRSSNAAGAAASPTGAARPTSASAKVVPTPKIADDDDIQLTFVLKKHRAIRPFAQNVSVKDCVRQVAKEWDVTLPPHTTASWGLRKNVPLKELAKIFVKIFRESPKEVITINVDAVDVDATKPAPAAAATKPTVSNDNDAAPVKANVEGGDTPTKVSSPVKAQEEGNDTPPTAAEKPKPKMTSSSSSSSTTLRLKYTLPDGSSENIMQDASTQLDDIFAIVESHLSGLGQLDGEFSLVISAPPPKRLMKEEHGSQTLAELGITSHSVMRVVPLGGGGGGGGGSGASPTSGQEGLVSRMWGGIAKWATTPGDGQDQPQQRPSSSSNTSGQQAPHNAPRPTSAGRSGGMRTLADIRREEEAAKQDQQGGRGPSNNSYFGGGSTEFLGRGNNNNNKKKDDEENA